MSEILSIKARMASLLAAIESISLQLTAVKVAGRNTVVIAAMTRMAALSRVAATATSLWFFDIFFSSALSRMLSAFSRCDMRL
jgi:hypothetical protein